MKTTFQPYFVAYANAHSNTPEKQLEKDRAEYPGGCMCGFILWISAMKRAFYKAKPGAFLSPDAISNHAAWAKFLKT